MLFAAASCADPAKPDYEACVLFETNGDYGNASLSCTKAKLASPDSKYSKLADEKLTAMKPKLDEMAAKAKADAEAKAAADEKAAEESLKTAVVDYSWCANLRARLDARYRAEAKQDFPDRDPSFVETVISQGVQNDYDSCVEDVGKRVAPYWECRWKSGGDGRKKCRDLKTQQDDDKK